MYFDKFANSKYIYMYKQIHVYFFANHIEETQIKSQVLYVGKSLDGLTWSVNSFTNGPSQPNNSSLKNNHGLSYKILGFFFTFALLRFCFFLHFIPMVFKTFYNVDVSNKIIIRKVEYLMKKIIKDNLFFLSCLSIFMLEFF